jgi:rhodanese-related sulfurtransferase
MKKLLLILSALLIFTACSKDENNQDTATQSSSTIAPVAVDQLAAYPVRQAAPQQKKNIFVSYAPIEAQQLIQQRQDLLIIDVRTPEELKDGQIENSILVSFWDIMKKKHQLPRNKPLLLVCAVGGRSYAAMQMLAQQGYPEIYNLKGGIYAWKSLKLPLAY